MLPDSTHSVPNNSNMGCGFTQAAKGFRHAAEDYDINVS